MGNLSVVYGQNKGNSGLKINDSLKYLPSIPPAHGIIEAKYSFDFNIGAIRKMFIKPNLEYYFTQNNVFLANNTETPTEGYVLLNLAIGFSWVNSNGTPIFNVYLFGNNLLDVSYQNHLSRLKYFEQYPGNQSGYSGIYGMGRNINIKINVPIN